MLRSTYALPFDPSVLRRCRLYGSTSVTFLGMQLELLAFSLTCAVDIDLLDWIYRDQTWVPEQTQSSNTKHSMKDINHVPWTVRHASMVSILSPISKLETLKGKGTNLASKNEVTEFSSINPMQPVDHG